MAILTVDEKLKLDSTSPTNQSQVNLGSHVAFAHGIVTMDASPKDVTLAGVEAGDTVLTSIVTNDTTGVGVQTAVAASGKITITSSEVTTGDGTLAYVVYKA